MSKGVTQAQARLPSSPVPQRLAKMPKQPRSEDLIRHRKYNRCVICEDRPAVAFKEMLVTIPDPEDDSVCKVVDIKWWTCLKCEEGRK
jgi:hypothetical protein